MRVLFVDDDEVTLFLYRRLVKSKAGLEVHYARNGSEALDWINALEDPIDALFLDINMPVMNGYEFLEMHMSLPAKKRVRNVFLMLGTQITEEQKLMAEKHLVADFVYKPLRDDRFSALLTQISQ